jgi:hypothetical protein
MSNYSFISETQQTSQSKYITSIMLEAEVKIVSYALQIRDQHPTQIFAAKFKTMTQNPRKECASIDNTIFQSREILWFFSRILQIVSTLHI